jgi:flagellar biosynthesis/type III secretory pathway M-ring protein FliF/YscJ
MDVHPEVLEERPPEIVAAVFHWGRSFIEQNGWFLVGAGVLFYCLWIKMQPYIKKFREHQEERRYAAFCHKNPDLVCARQVAMEAARQRLQAELDEKSKLHAEKVKQREAKKREEYLAMQEARGTVQLGHRLSDQTTTTHSDNKGQKSKSSYRPGI